MNPLDRLMAATERLLDDAAAAVVSTFESNFPGGLGNHGDPMEDLLHDVTDLVEDAVKSFTVGMVTDCVQADAGARGVVTVGVPETTAPMPLAPCLAMAIVPGRLPGAPATPVVRPDHVTPGERTVDVSIDAAGCPGVYLGHLVDESGVMQRPFLIFLDGLTG